MIDPSVTSPQVSVNVVPMNPFRCRMWALHDRIEDYITDESCREEILSFNKHGQLIPVLGRPLHGCPEFDMELIYGARRLYIARQLNRPLMVRIEKLTDREALVAMQIENRHRQDVSPYERGVSYARTLRTNMFLSQDEFAKALCISASQVSRLVRLSQLPAAVVGAFGSPSRITEKWGLALVQALADARHRIVILQRARALATESSGRDPRATFERLIAPINVRGSGQKTRRPARTQGDVVMGSDGEPLFSIRQRGRCTTLYFPDAAAQSMLYRELRSAVAEILERYRHHTS